jgi:hypothetical protein
VKISLRKKEETFWGLNSQIFLSIYLIEFPILAKAKGVILKPPDYFGHSNEQLFNS